MDDPTTIENNKNVGLREPEYYIKVNAKQAADQGYTRGYEAGRNSTTSVEDCQTMWWGFSPSITKVVEEITGIPHHLFYYNSRNWDTTQAAENAYRRGFADGQKARSPS